MLQGFSLTAIAISLLLTTSLKTNAQSFQKFSPDLSRNISKSLTDTLKQQQHAPGITANDFSKITIRNGPDIPTPTVPSPSAPSTEPILGRAIPPIESGSMSSFDIADPKSAPRDRVSEVFDPKIIGGNPAQVGAFPWQVMLITGDLADPIRSGFCGGSLVAAQWVVTAAHCLAGKSEPGLIDIVSGTIVPRISGQGDRVKVIKMVIHPQYKQVNFENDIAMLQLQRPVTVGAPIRLAKPSLAIPVNALATVSGWGAVTAYGPMTDQLLYAQIPVVANEICNKTTSYSGAVTAGMLCAGYRDGGLDACQGDSGGPLMAKVDNLPTLIGIVSWGKGCALRLKYGVYTRVTDYSEWALSEINRRAVAIR